MFLTPLSSPPTFGYFWGIWAKFGQGEDGPERLRYGRDMPGISALNTPTPQKWAAVVSGQVWKRWGLSPEGQLEAQTIRGPVIVWARATVCGEEEGPKLEAPKPTPLDLRVWAVNTTAHFEKFRKAARGKVRASVRWKTAKPITKRLARKQLVLIEEKYFKICSSFHDDFIWQYFKGNPKRIFSELGLWFDADEYILKLFTKRKRKRIRGIKRQNETESARKLYRHVETDFPDYSQQNEDEKAERLKYIRVSDDRLSRILTALDKGKMPEPQDVKDMAHEDGRNIPLLHLMSYFSPTFTQTRPEIYRALLRFLRDLTGFKTIKDTLTLKRLDGDAYLAHARRRVKPAPRRGRIPRPAHAVPRPPTAPLAPPVA